MCYYNKYGIKECKKTSCDKEEYYNYWGKKGYEFVEGRTVNKQTGFTEWIWIKRKKLNYLNPK